MFSEGVCKAFKYFTQVKMMYKFHIQKCGLPFTKKEQEDQLELIHCKVHLRVKVNVEHL